MVGEIILFALWFLSGWAFNSFAAGMKKEIEALKAADRLIAKTIREQVERIDELKEALKSSELERNRLTVQPEKPKIALKRATWKQFRSAAEAEPENPE